MTASTSGASLLPQSEALYRDIRRMDMTKPSLTPGELREHLAAIEAAAAAAARAEADRLREALAAVRRPDERHGHCWCPQTWHEHMKRMGAPHSKVCLDARAALDAEGAS